MRIIASNNPMGIEINLGFYALCEAILTGKCCGEVLKKWCGIEFTRHGKSKPQKLTGKKQKKILFYFQKYGDSLQYIEIAKKVGCSKQLVTHTLRQIGIAPKPPYYTREGVQHGYGKRSK